MSVFNGGKSWGHAQKHKNETRKVGVTSEPNDPIMLAGISRFFFNYSSSNGHLPQPTHTHYPEGVGVQNRDPSWFYLRGGENSYFSVFSGKGKFPYFGAKANFRISF